MRVFVSLCLLIAMALLASGPARAGGSSPRVSATAHGVRLDLRLPPGPYLRDQLLVAHVSLTNVSRRTIWEAPMVVGFCVRTPLLINVLGADGRPLSPLPPDPRTEYPSCAAPVPAPLRPGATTARSVFVALLSGRLQATANVNTVAGSRVYNGATLSTPVLTVPLRSAPAPAVTVVQRNGELAAIVSRPAGARGRLRYQEWADCPTSHTISPAPNWLIAPPDDTISAECPNPTAWHLIAGWKRYPVASFGYPAATVPIAPPFASAPYRVHVGDVIDMRYLVFGPGTAGASADPAYLRLISSTALGAEPVRYEWRWQAIRPGETRIEIERQAPSLAPVVVRVLILPS